MRIDLTPGVPAAVAQSVGDANWLRMATQLAGDPQPHA